MLLKRIEEYNFPYDLKQMNIDEKELLSVQIREFLIDKVSKTGGHLASNLGAVELSIAIHSVFDSPKDKIIWDVGHQAYVHKILTGRAQSFDLLRQFEGLSGFPKARESEHDAFDTGHSSTSLSAAFGYAAARDIKKERHEVVAVIGDGSMTGGMAFEALNSIGFRHSKVIIILNDNGMSISKNVGGFSKYLGDLRTSEPYLNTKKFIKNNIGGNIAAGLANIKNDIKSSVIPEKGKLFEDMGITYFGPVDGHNIEEMENVMQKAKGLNEPCLIHVITKKGKGYSHSEKMPRKFHGIGPFNPETGEILNKSDKPSFSKIMGDHLLEIAQKNGSVVAITAAMGEATGLKDFSIQIPDRFYDVGIAEQNAVTFAAGLAKAGMRPFVCIYSTFLQRSYDQIMMDVCLQKLPVVFCIDRAGVVGADGETHNGVFDLSYLSSMPGMTILAPKDGDELRKMLDWALENTDGPTAIRYPRGTTDTISEKDDNFVPGSARFYNGKDIDIWACGNMFKTAEKVREILLDSNIESGVVEVSMVKPIDVKPYFDTKCKFILTIEDNVINGGLGEQLQNALNNEDIKIIRAGWPDIFIEQGNFDQLAEKHKMDPGSIAKRIKDYLKSVD